MNHHHHNLIYHFTIEPILLVAGIVATGAMLGGAFAAAWWVFDVIFVNHDGFAFHWHLGGPRPGDHLLLLFGIGCVLPFILGAYALVKGEDDGRAS